jgi:hypothetical protein
VAERSCNRVSPANTLKSKIKFNFRDSLVPPHTGRITDQIIHRLSIIGLLASSSRRTLSVHDCREGTRYDIAMRREGSA